MVRVSVVVSQLKVDTRQGQVCCTRRNFNMKYACELSFGVVVSVDSWLQERYLNILYECVGVLYIFV